MLAISFQVSKKTIMSDSEQLFHVPIQRTNALGYCKGDSEETLESLQTLKLVKYVAKGREKRHLSTLGLWGSPGWKISYQRDKAHLGFLFQ